jgi:ABC-type sugar transport system substrate-binding protein
MSVRQSGSIDYSKKIDKPIVYISSLLNKNKSSSFDFFVEIITCISEKLSLDYDLIVKIPSSTHPSQAQLIEKIIEQSDNYGLFIVAPFNTLELKKILEGKDIRIPIITIDKYFDTIKNNNTNIEIPYISADWKEGGKLAADIFIEHFKNKDKVTILILEGLEGSQVRIDGFTERIKETNKRGCKKRKSNPCIKCKSGSDCKFSLIKSDTLDFSRESATTYLKRFLQDNPNLQIDGIFACNDEMALGARDTLQELTKNGNHQNIKIVGFDGINEVKFILKNNKDDLLLGSIDVNISQQVEHLVNSIKSNSLGGKKELVNCNPITSTNSND